MLGTCLASFSFILVSSVFGMPISGTHTVIGALIGAGLAGLAVEDLNWGKVLLTVLSWFLSPMLASILAGILFIIICSITLGGNVLSATMRLNYLTLISGVSIAFSTFMLIGLIDPTPSSEAYYSILGAFFLGVIVCRFVLTLNTSYSSNEPLTTSEFIYSTFAIWTF
jgi:PiT family inorganic phosphate transporter